MGRRGHFGDGKVLGDEDETTNDEIISAISGFENLIKVFLLCIER